MKNRNRKCIIIIDNDDDGMDVAVLSNNQTDDINIDYLIERLNNNAFTNNDAKRILNDWYYERLNNK